MVHRMFMKRTSCLSILFLAVLCSFVSVQNSWAQFTEYKITASDGDPNDRFGESVSIDGTRAVVGAFRDDDAGSDAGAAYVFDFSNGSWTQSAKLTPNDGTSFPSNRNNSLFGSVVDVLNDVIVVGAIDGRENGVKTGTAYVFERSELGEWLQVSRLTAFDGSNNDKFGSSIATNGEYALVGSLDDDHSGLSNAGSVYVFRRNAENGDANISWDFVQKIIPEDAQEGDSFGWSVAVSGDRAIIGARDDDRGAANAGSAYIYELEGSEWVQTAKIFASDPQAEDSFGEIVAIEGDQVVVGARDVDINGMENVGAAYVFELQNEDWVETGKLLSSDGASDDLFATSVSIDGNYLAASTRRKDQLRGAVYLYQKFGSTWNEVAKLEPTGLDAGDLFGQSVHLSGSLLVVGTKGDDEKGVEAGAAHIFDLVSSDRGALISLYNSTDGPNWSNTDNWLSDEPLNTWHGISTNDDGQVTEIDLGDNNNGVVPKFLFPIMLLQSVETPLHPAALAV